MEKTIWFVRNCTFAYVGCEGSTQEFLSLPLLGLSGVASLLKVLQSASKVLDIILELVHSPGGKSKMNRFVIRRTKTFVAQ